MPRPGGSQGQLRESDWTTILEWCQANLKGDKSELQDAVEHFARPENGSLLFGKESLRRRLKEWEEAKLDVSEPEVKLKGGQPVLTDSQWMEVLDFIDAHPELSKERVAKHFHRQGLKFHRTSIGGKHLEAIQRRVQALREKRMAMKTKGQTTETEIMKREDSSTSGSMLASSSKDTSTTQDTESPTAEKPQNTFLTTSQWRQVLEFMHAHPTYTLKQITDHFAKQGIKFHMSSISGRQLEAKKRRVGWQESKAANAKPKTRSHSEGKVERRGSSKRSGNSEPKSGPAQASSSKAPPIRPPATTTGRRVARKSKPNRHIYHLTDAEWVQVFEFMDDHPEYNQSQVWRHFTNLGFKFHRTTIGTKLKKREAIERRALAGEGKGKGKEEAASSAQRRSSRLPRGSSTSKRYVESDSSISSESEEDEDEDDEEDSESQEDSLEEDEGDEDTDGEEDEEADEEEDEEEFRDTAPSELTPPPESPIVDAAPFVGLTSVPATVTAEATAQPSPSPTPSRESSPEPGERSPTPEVVVRKRRKLTDAQWLRVFDFMDNNPRVTKTELTRHFGRQGLTFHRKTLNRRLKERNAIEKRATNTTNSTTSVSCVSPDTTMASPSPPASEAADEGEISAMPLLKEEEEEGSSSTPNSPVEGDVGATVRSGNAVAQLEADVALSASVHLSESSDDVAVDEPPVTLTAPPRFKRKRIHQDGISPATPEESQDEKRVRLTPLSISIHHESLSPAASLAVPSLCAASQATVSDSSVTTPRSSMTPSEPHSALVLQTDSKADEHIDSPLTPTSTHSFGPSETEDIEMDSDSESSCSRLPRAPIPISKPRDSIEYSVEVMGRLASLIINHNARYWFFAYVLLTSTHSPLSPPRHHHSHHHPGRLVRSP
ncbi:hypothetical protein NMY22_g13124 [Coprinellus aureogranulatus]|nr:hypothetical protein NMY22_g13124 [Coprinellus aureogranulatus]